MKDFDYKFNLKSTGQVINFKYWTLREEKELFLEVNNPNLTKDERTEIFLNFFKSHIKEKDLFDTFTKQDIYQLLIELRSYSKGNTIQYEWKCTHEECSAKGESQPNTFDITQDFDFPIDTIENLQIKSYELNFKQIDIYKELSIIEKNIATPEQIKFDILLEHIDNILHNGKLQTFTGLQDKKDYILDQPPFVGIELSKNYKKIVSDVSIKKKNVCVSCKEKYPLSIGDLNFFFTLLLLA